MQTRKELINACHKVYDKGFVAAYDGNLSCRLGEDKFLITPSAKCKGELCEDDLLVINSLGEVLEGNGKTSTEYKLHMMLYKSRSDINAVVHCHPVFATVVGLTCNSLDVTLLPEVLLTLGKVPVCEYGTPSTEELPNSLTPSIDYANVYLLKNHGAVTAGKNISDAYYKMEKLEHTCKIITNANMSGTPEAIPQNKIKQLYDIAETAYGIKVSAKNRMDNI